jgi:hypothetical protein
MQGTSWIAHAGGVGRLIQLRGPDRHSSGIDHALLMASRGYIVSLDLHKIIIHDRCSNTGSDIRSLSDR